MAFYLIDFENIKNITQVADLSEQDTIVFFYSQNANALSFDLHIELDKTAAKKEYFMGQCGGKNALDFQLCSYVGYLIAKYPQDKIYIISKDKGFGHLVSFWKERGFEQLEIRENVGEDEMDTVTSDSCKETPCHSTLAHHAVETLAEVLKKNAKELKLKPEQCKEIERIVNSFKTKQAVNNNLMKLFRDSDKVGKITRIIKPFLSGKK